MYYIEKGKELTVSQLSRMLQDFQTHEIPRLKKLYNYYIGKQDILNKKPTDTGKPCNKVVVNYCQSCVDTYNGYLTGIDINYDSDDDIEQIIEVLNYNDVHSTDTQLLKDALIFGRSCELEYIDEEAKQRFRTVSPMNAFPIYDDTVEQKLVYGVRISAIHNPELSITEYAVDVYSDLEIFHYKATSDLSTVRLIDAEPHFYGQVPMVFMSLNSEEMSIFESILTLQDAYNELLSSNIDDFDSFADAYLVFKGIIPDAEELADMKQHRALVIGEDSDVSYLTKDINNTNVENMLTIIDEKIHTIALFPDFNDDSFKTSSGIALKMKLIGFENKSSTIEANMRMALQRRIELICGILNLSADDAVWRDVVITFTRNLPTNTDEIVELVNNLRGLVSTETLLGLLPFIDNPEDEMKRIKAEKQESYDLYNFGGNEVEDEE